MMGKIDVRLQVDRRQSSTAKRQIVARIFSLLKKIDK
jgi:hypothetical protein